MSHIAGLGKVVVHDVADEAMPDDDDDDFGPFDEDSVRILLMMFVTVSSVLHPPKPRHSPCQQAVKHKHKDKQSTASRNRQHDSRKDERLESPNKCYTVRTRTVFHRLSLS